MAEQRSEGDEGRAPRRRSVVGSMLLMLAGIIILLITAKGSLFALRYRDRTPDKVTVTDLLAGKIAEGSWVAVSGCYLDTVGVDHYVVSQNEMGTREQLGEKYTYRVLVSGEKDAVANWYVKVAMQRRSDVLTSPAVNPASDVRYIAVVDYAKNWPVKGLAEFELPHPQASSPRSVSNYPIQAENTEASEPAPTFATTTIQGVVGMMPDRVHEKFALSTGGEISPVELRTWEKPNWRLPWWSLGGLLFLLLGCGWFWVLRHPMNAMPEQHLLPEV